MSVIAAILISLFTGSYAISWLRGYPNPPQSSRSSFVVITDIHLDHQLKNQSAYRKTDTSEGLWQSVKQELTAVVAHQHPKFILLLGDLPAHQPLNKLNIGQYRLNTKIVMHELRAITQRQGIGIPIIYVPGNNDSWDGDYHSFSDWSGHNIFELDPQGNWPLVHGNRHCQFLSHRACIANSRHQRFGYYSTYPLGSDQHLLVIVLNTIIFSSHYASDDTINQANLAQDQLQWLEKQLHMAKQHHDHVYLAMHIPPGLDAYSKKPMWTRTVNIDGVSIQHQFLTLIKQYHASIKAIFSGHTHMNELRRLVNFTTGKIDVVNFGVPGITPLHGNSPAFQLFQYKKNYEPIDRTTYYSQPNGEHWHSYHFQQTYACHGLAIQQCLNNMQKDKFIRAYNHQYAVANPNYTGNWTSIDRATQLTLPRA